MELQIGDMVRFRADDSELIGMVEAMSDDTYSVRVWATAADEIVPTDVVMSITAADLIDIDDFDDEEEEEEGEELTEGDSVKWLTANGEAYGIVAGIHPDGFIVPDTGEAVKGRVVEVEAYEATGDGYAATGINVGLKAADLKRIPAFEIAEAKRLPRYVGKVKQAEYEEETGTGRIKGYLSVFDNVDLGGDVVKRGAFTQTLSHKGGKTVFMLDHGWKTEQVIGVLYLREDDKGLWMDGAVNLSTPQGRMAFDTAKFQIDNGMPIGASIGYGIVKASPNAHGGFDLHEVKLYEGSMTPFPMNESALITEAKKRYDHKTRQKRAVKLMTTRPLGSRAESGDEITDDDILQSLNYKE